MAVLGDDILEALFFSEMEHTNPGHLYLKEDMTTPETENITTPEHTVCVRYKPTVYVSWYHWLYIMQFSDDVQRQRKLGTFAEWHYSLLMMPAPANDPDIIFQVRANPTQWTQILAEGGTYYTSPDIDRINAGEWHHFCGGSSVKDLRTFFVQNGKTVYNWSQPESWGGKENYLSSEILRKAYTTYLPGMNETWENIVSFAKIQLGGTWDHEYYLTDFNIWGRALSRQEMYDFTTCKVTATHILVPWLVFSNHITTLLVNRAKHHSSTRNQTQFNMHNFLLNFL